MVNAIRPSTSQPVYTLFYALEAYHANKGSRPYVDYDILRDIIYDNVVRGSAPIQTLLDKMVKVRYPLNASLTEIFDLAVKREPQEAKPEEQLPPPPELPLQPTVEYMNSLIDNMNAMIASYPALSRDPSLFAKYYHLRCVLKSLLSPY